MIRALVVLALLTTAARADLCPDGEVFDATRGCVKPSPKAPPALTDYYAGLAALAKNDADKAFRLFDRSCKAKHGPACTKLAFLYETGRARATHRDDKKARALFEQACTYGDGQGCQRTGNFAMNEGSTDAARAWLDKGCKLDNGPACAQHAFLLRDEKDAAKHYAHAWKLLDKACPREGVACLARGLMFKGGIGTTADADKALAAFRQSCAANLNDGCVQAAQMLDERPGNEAEARQLWTSGCTMESARACTISAKRTIVANPKDPHAYELAEKACTLDTKECEFLAVLTDNGEGGAKADRGRATALFRSLCDSGDQGGCTKLATRVRSGIGTKADPAAADQLLASACDGNEPVACTRLAHEFTVSKKDDAHGFTIAKRGCDLGDPAGCYVAGWDIRYNRRGTAKLEDAAAAKEALPWFERGCSADPYDAVACHEAALIHDAGLGTAVDKPAAAERFRKACSSEDFPRPAACVSLATMVEAGIAGQKPDAGEALRLMVRACVHDHVEACKWIPSHARSADEIQAVDAALGPVCAAGGHDDTCMQLVMTHTGAGSGEDKRAVAAVIDGMCARKNPQGCYFRASNFYAGYGVAQDKAKGKALYQELCDEPADVEADHRWEANACFELLRIHIENKEDNQVLSTAERACKLGNGDGCNHVAYLHYTASSGVTWSGDLAVEYWTKGCDKGSPGACANRAELLRFGIGGTIDLKESARLYKLGCDTGNAYACTGWGRFLATGEGGVTRDVAAAEKLLRDACKNDDGVACVDLAELLDGKHAATSEIAGLRTQGFTIIERAATVDANPEYMWRIGTFYRDGVVKPKDEAKAREWLARSCEKYDPLGCLDAGRAFSTFDRAKAKFFYNQACASKLEEGCAGARAVDGAPVQKVKAKGCGCGTANDASPLLGLSLLLLWRRRPRSRAGSSRDRARA